MTIYTIALFGEAEKGEYSIPYLCNSLADLENHFGNPPAHSYGLYYAIQALLYNRQLIFCRVREEGYSKLDYLGALPLIKNSTLSDISAFYLPGVGNFEILEAITPMCKKFHSILIINEADFYDYLMETV
ncbi:MAG: hypothetical protein BGO14_10640 [Chlamydiales bacterium 38-26]|nr:hypothetical protein [Chlamydiales bacterium]OJV11411.1 MAG: hypothetical protein BGO14_10640 [Chlamydiales bacterium 38-26]